MRSVKVSVVVADAISFDADVLALKYAEGLYGVDRVVHERLVDHGIQPKLPRVSDFTLCATTGALGASRVLFVGVGVLYEFGYTEIRNFARKVLALLSDQEVRRLALTIHGPGYGLDEIEAFESELAGIVDAVSEGRVPARLESIFFVERNRARAQRLSVVLKRLLPDGSLTLNSSANLADQARSTLRSAGYASASKPHVFVAMPFAEGKDDVFHYGIQAAVNAAGMLCERADLSTFTGDVMDWVKRRIATAKLVIADLSSANPNVYLEVGYAWGCSIPTVLLADDTNALKFDVRAQRCIVYKSIRQLEEVLTRELHGLSLGPVSKED